MSSEKAFIGAFIYRIQEAGVAQLVEHQPSKLRVAGSSLVSRSKRALMIRWAVLSFRYFYSVGHMPTDLKKIVKPM